MTAINKLFVEDGVLRNIYKPISLVGCNVRGQAYNPNRDTGVAGWNNTGFDDPFTYALTDSLNIKKYGFNCVRTGGVNWGLLETSSSPAEFKYDPEYLQAIVDFVHIYNARGIYVILDMHLQDGPVGMARVSDFLPVSGDRLTDSFFSDTGPTSAREHLRQLWLMLSSIFKNESGVAGYDYMNEPGTYWTGSLPGMEVANYWIDIVDYVTATLRSVGDNHVIMPCMAPYARMVFLPRDFADPNIALSPHGYQGTDGATNVITSDIGQLRSDFNSEIGDPALTVNRPVVLGEFGNLVSIDTPEKDAWMRNYLTVSLENEKTQGWLYWTYVAYKGGESVTIGWQEIMAEYLPMPIPPLAIIAGLAIPTIVILWWLLR